MTFQVKCACGAELTIKAWLVREVDMPAWWLAQHRDCSKNATPESEVSDGRG